MKRVKEIWTKSMYIFNRRQKWRLVGLSTILVMEIMLELLGVVSVYPFIALVMSPDMIETNSILQWLYDISGVSSNEHFFLLVAILIICFYIFKNMFNAFAQYMRYGFIFDTKREIGVRLMRDYMQEPYSFFLEKNSSVLMRGVGTDTSQFFDLVFNCLYLLSDIVMMLAFGIYLLYADFWLSVSVILVMVLFVLIFMKWNKKRAMHYGRETQNCASKMTQWLQQAFGGAKEIKILHREDYFVENYNKYCTETNRMNRIFSFLNSIPHQVLECFCTAVILLVIAIRILNGANAALFVPQMAVFAMALFRLFPRISRINTSVNAVLFGYPYLDSLYNDLKMTEEHKYIRKLKEDVGKKEHELTFNDEIELEHVHYSYPNTDVEVLIDICMKVKKGQAVGLVGPSGAGKTTLADVFLGILELKSGRVLCDGKDIQNHIGEWSDKLGYIPQTIFLSDDSIRNNVAFGLNVDETSDDKIWSALEQAQLKEYVETLPDGLDTRLGERGIRFSGGQRQRIGIARALYNNPDILVLDEATSALDTETEQAVMESIEHLLGHKTMIIIAHRITTVRNCDVIFRVENGGIKEVTYAELESETIRSSGE